MDHLWAPSGDSNCPWVYISLPLGAPAIGVLYDEKAPGRIRLESIIESGTDIPRDALALLLRSGRDTFIITQGRVQGSRPPGGLVQLRHQDSVTVPLPGHGDEDEPPTLTFYVCADGLIEPFAYEPPPGKSVPALCAVCHLPLKTGEMVRRACPGPDCGTLIHEECGEGSCPLCKQEIADSTGESTIWIPGA